MKRTPRLFLDRRTLLGLSATMLLGACTALPGRTARATLYDFGPGPRDANVVPTVSAPRRPALILAEIESNARLDNTQLLYRLNYADAHELQPYAHARWSLPPAQLLRQRLWAALAAQRVVLDPQDAASISRAPGQVPATLRLTLEEFSHCFDTSTASVGLIRVRATLAQGSSGGDRIVGQRVFTVQRPAPTPDALGGVKALTAASDALIEQIIAWVDA